MAQNEHGCEFVSPCTLVIGASTPIECILAIPTAYNISMDIFYDSPFTLVIGASIVMECILATDCLRFNDGPPVRQEINERFMFNYFQFCGFSVLTLT